MRGRGRLINVEVDIHPWGQRMIFLNNSIQSKSSIEEAYNFATNVSLSALLMCEDSLCGWQDKMSELPRWQNVASPFFKIREKYIISGTDYSTLVDTANQFNHNFFTPVIIDDLELSNIVVFLHDSQEFYQDLWHRSEKYLLLTLSFCIDNSA